jgi:5-hydroxyisourate hydrolase
MSGVSTHILDTSAGRPAAGVRVRLFHAFDEIASQLTDQDGRCASLLPPNAALAPGDYRLLFEIGPYFPTGFFPEVSVSFRIESPSARYHVPLLISPFGYSTYRGS